MMLHPVTGSETSVKTVPFWGLVEACFSFSREHELRGGSLTFLLSSVRPQPLQPHAEELSP